MSEVDDLKRFLQQGFEVNKCTICLEPFDTNHSPVRFTAPASCNHIFGQGCLMAWLTSGDDNSNKCPTCRRILYGQDEHPSNDEREENEVDIEYEMPTERPPQHSME